MIEEKIMEIMNTIQYGVPDEQNNNLLDIIDDDIVFNKYYKLQTPEELLKSKLGVCWDKDNLPSHTFLTYERNKKYYWFEHSDNKYAGIHEYITKEELLNDVKDKFIKSHNVREETIKIYLYKTMPFHISCWDY